MINTLVMEDNKNMIESLLKRAAEYGTISLELAKLKAIDKTSDIVSSFVLNFIVTTFILSFVLFFNVGLALWLGEILGKTYYGFFLVAAIYLFAGIFINLVMHKWLKKLACDSFIKQVLK